MRRSEWNWMTRRGNKCRDHTTLCEPPRNDRLWIRGTGNSGDPSKQLVLQIMFRLAPRTLRGEMEPNCASDVVQQLVWLVESSPYQLAIASPATHQAALCLSAMVPWLL